MCEPQTPHGGSMERWIRILAGILAALVAYNEAIKKP